MALNDYAGTWEYMGSVIPQFGLDWESGDYFVGTTNSGSDVARILCYGNPNAIESYGYIRCVYDMGDLIFGKWVRFYFSESKQILNLPAPSEILVNPAVIRRFQVMKKPKRYWRNYWGVVEDYNWAVALEVLAEAALPAEIAAILEANPSKVFNIGNSGNIIIVLQDQAQLPNGEP